MKKVKNLFLDILVWYAVFATCFVIPVQIALAQANNLSCDKPITRMEILFPGYIIGCWFSRPLK